MSSASGETAETSPPTTAAAPPAASVAALNPAQHPTPTGSGAPVDPTVQATIVNPDQIVEERGEIPPLYVGKVIGKGGEVSIGYQCH